MSNSTDNQTDADSETALEESSDEILELDEQVDDESSQDDGDDAIEERDTEPIRESEEEDEQVDDEAEDDAGDDDEILKPEEVPAAAVVKPSEQGDANEFEEGELEETAPREALDDEESARSTDEMEEPPGEAGDIESVTAKGVSGSTTSEVEADDEGGAASGLHETIQMEALDRAAIEREGQFRELEETQPVLDNRMAPEVIAAPPAHRVDQWHPLSTVLEELESPAAIDTSGPEESSNEPPESETGRARRPTPAARPAATAAPESSEAGGSSPGRPPPTEGLDDAAADAERTESLADAISDATTSGEQRDIDPTSDTAPAPAEAVDPGAAPQRPEVPSQDAQALETPDWIEQAFGEHYLLTVSGDVQQRTARQADFIEESLSLTPEDRVLDLACGFGRHTIELASRGYQVVGFDLSKPLLERAVKEANRNSLQVNFIHGDMRALQFENVFDACFCWQTSFGYFDDETNLNILQRLGRALQPGGELLLQVVNRDYVVEDMPHRMWWEGTECVFLEEGEFDSSSSMMHLERSFIYEDGRQPLEHDYFIRLYSLHELEKMLRTAGFQPLEVSGAIHYRGDFLGSDSPHIIVRASRQ